MAAKVYLNQLSQEVLDFIGAGGSGGGDAVLMRDILANVAIGAAPAGTTYPRGQNFTEFVELISHKDVAPSISTSFTGSGLREKGSTVNGSTMTLTIDNLAAVTVPIETINFYDGNTQVFTTPFVKGTATYKYNYPALISTDKTLKAELVYNGGKKVFGTGTITFVYPSYYGVTALDNITSADLLSLIPKFTKSVKASKALTWNNITLNDQRFCYAYPASMGTLSSIKDGNGFSQLEGYKRIQVSIDSPCDGRTVPYYVYLLKDATTGSGFVQIFS